MSEATGAAVPNPLLLQGNDSSIVFASPEHVLLMPSLLRLTVGRCSSSCSVADRRPTSTDRLVSTNATLTYAPPASWTHSQCSVRLPLFAAAGRSKSLENCSRPLRSVFRGRITVCGFLAATLTNQVIELSGNPFSFSCPNAADFSSWRRCGSPQRAQILPFRQLQPPPIARA